MPPSPAPDTCWLYLIRHAATDNNCAHPPRLQGRRSDPALSAAGRQQAEQTARLLAALPLQAIYCSPLLRARQTAEIIARPHGLAVHAVAELVEIDVGQWEGRTWEEIRQADPEAYRLFLTDAAVHPYLGGENLSTAQARIVPALEKLMADNLGSMIAAVTHNVINRAYLAHLLSVPLAKHRGIPQDNCGVNLLCYRHRQTKPITINEIWHLGETSGRS